MVNFCAVYNCANRSGREKDKSFYRIPKVTLKQGPEGENLSRTRREKWLNAISRTDIREHRQKILEFFIGIWPLT